MSSAEDIANTLTEPMRRTLRMTYRPHPEAHSLLWVIPAYANGRTVAALQRRGLAEGRRLTADGVIVRSLVLP